MAISDTARRNHDELFPGRVSTLAQTDPELIEHFDNFAFDEVISDSGLDIRTRLMVQLASCGGTYPIQTTPAFFQAINPYMPMTYVVEGLREAITGGIETRFWVAAGILLAIFVVSLAASSLAAARKRVWTMSRLHPALSI